MMAMRLSRIFSSACWCIFAMSPWSLRVAIQAEFAAYIFDYSDCGQAIFASSDASVDWCGHDTVENALGRLKGQRGSPRIFRGHPHGDLGLALSGELG